jgi:hypothetical protein
MLKTLDRKGIIAELENLFEHSHKELVIVSPYVKLNKKLIELLDKGQKRKIELMFICKYDALSSEVRNTLSSYANVSILDLPDVHSKAYLNEDTAVVSSMNFYSSSMRQNYELGTLLSLKDEGPFYKETIVRTAFNDLCDYIGQMYYASRVVQMSEKVSQGFRFRIVRTNKDMAEQFVQKLNHSFVNKRFKTGGFKTPESWEAVCENFTDEFQVVVQPAFKLDQGMKEVSGIYRLELDCQLIVERTLPYYSVAAFQENEFHFEKFKVYWSSPLNPILIYRDMTNHPEFWNNCDWNLQCSLFTGIVNQITHEFSKSIRMTA